MNLKQCSICLEMCRSTVSVHDTDENYIKCYTKLQFVVPELEWLEEYVICESCKKLLENAWNFKKLVLNLETKRRLKLTKETYPEEDNDCKDNCDTECCYTEDKEISCGDCFRTFTTETQIRQHRLQAHSEEYCNTLEKIVTFSNSSRVNDLFTCYDCDIGFITKENLLSHIEHEHAAKLCLVCEKLCPNRSVLESHMRYEHSIKMCKDYVCPECCRQFESEIKLNEHCAVCRKFQCSICMESYNSKEVLIEHLKLCYINKTETNVSSNQCSSCSNFYTSKKNLNLHKTWCTNEKRANTDNKTIVKYDCNICNIKFQSFENCNSHSCLKHKPQKKGSDILNNKKKKIGTKSSRPLRTFTCEVCEAQFGLVKLVVEHCVSEHAMEKKSVKPYLCDKCDMRFASSANLDQHRHYHNKNRSHVCSLCGKGFITKSDLTVHEYTHYNRRNYKCSKCDKAFNTNKNLRTHDLVVHTDRSLWKYGCSICEKRFPLKSNYELHLRRHTGEKHHACHICRKSFISKTELRRHIRLHSNIKAFKCPNCEKEYKERRTYEAHLAKVHGIGDMKIPVREKKFVCHICPSQFYDKQKLSKHLCSHSGLKPYPCYTCDKKFTDKSDLKRHLKAAHNIVEPLKMEMVE